jgi:methionyl-tRNA synthetase
MSDEHFYITTPIYYVNDKPHIGHAYTTLLADVMAQYHRLLGEDVHFLTGTDEHGQKVQNAAEAAGITPQEQADNTVVRFKDLWERLEISHDDFIRTTEERHTVIVQQLLQKLYDEGKIYRDEYEGWYSVSDERFYTEKELVDGKSPEGKTVEKITEANYFFKMGSYQEWLINYINDNPEFIQPDHRRNETLGFLQKPLGDLCISRPKSRLSWGIELPFDADFVTYVWFDALVNYISGVGYGADEAQFKKWWPANYHLIGKDILTTHTVYWPTMLEAAGLPQAKTIFAHGWWLSKKAEEDEAGKMGKSEGNAVDPMSYADDYGVDALRYFLMAEMTLGQDATFGDDIFERRYNADLANDLGNLATRVLKMIAANCEGEIPEIDSAHVGEPEEALQASVLAAVESMAKSVSDMRLDRGLTDVLSVVRDTNKYFNDRAPWKQVKESDPGPFKVTLYTAAEVLRIVAGLLYPVMPQKMAALREALGITEAKPDLGQLREWGALPAGNKTHSVILFPKVDKPKPAAPAVKLSTQKASKKAAAKKKEDDVEETGIITFEDFSKVDLRTAKIVEAEKVEGSAKLLRLVVFVGEERRQIVAGIAIYYEPDDLIGKTIVIVANLKPRKIFGIESNGMLLAARTETRLKLVTVDGELISGASVG